MCAFAICPISPICVFLIPTTVCISTQLQALPSSYPCISIGYYPTKSSTLSSHHLSTECFPSLSFSWPYFLPPAVDLSTCSPTAQSWLQKLEAQLPTCYIILPADAHLHTCTLVHCTLAHWYTALLTANYTMPTAQTSHCKLSEFAAYLLLRLLDIISRRILKISMGINDTCDEPFKSFSFAGNQLTSSTLSWRKCPEIMF